MEQLLNSPIQDLTLCESKMELFVEIDVISLSCQILKNRIVLRNRMLKEKAKNRCKTIEILTLPQPRMELERLEVAECQNRL